MRLASLEFAMTKQDSKPTTTDVDKALTSALQTGSTEHLRAFRNVPYHICITFIDVSQTISITETRDYAINKIVSNLEESQDAAYVLNCLQCLQQCVLSQTRSDLAYMQQLNAILLKVHEDQLYVANILLFMLY